MATMAHQLAEFAAAVRYEALPSPVVNAAKRALLDTLGCALGAVDCEPARIVAASLPRTGDRSATLIGNRARTSPENAALVNGVLARYLDFMDVYEARDACHPSENVPLALACVEAGGGSGRELIETIVIGYEAQLRLADAFSFQAAGMHHVSAAGFVAPLIIGKAMKLPVAQLAQAVALSGVRHLTVHALSKGHLSMAKAAAYPLTAMESFLATRLAARGFTGPIESVEWLFAQVPRKAGAAPPAALDLDLSRFLIERVSLKQFPVQFELQGPVELACRLRARLHERPGGISRVVVEVLAKTKERTADPAKYVPGNRETADHSLPICVAIALQDGRLGPDQFESGRWRHADVLALAARVEVVASNSLAQRLPDGRPAVITVELADGMRLVDAEDVPLGDPARPMDDAQMVDKFLGLAQPVLGKRRARSVVKAVRKLEQMGNLRDLMRLLESPRRRAAQVQQTSTP